LRVNRASDDPTAFAQARRLEHLNQRYEQYLRTIGGATSWIDHTQDTLDQMADRITEAYEQGIRANSQVFDGPDRNAQADRIELILSDVVDLLNATDGEEYLFAGSRTTVEPFSVAGGGVVYNGNTTGRSRQIGDNLRMDINLTGDSIHDTGAGFTITESLQELADAVRTGDPTQMETALDHIVTARDHVFERGAEAGGISNRLQHAADQLRSATLRVDSHRSEVEDVDMAEAIMEYQRAQTGLQAALQVTASVLQTSLLNYLR
jgi:flagellar hook-associated protein 3 FlgL